MNRTIDFIVDELKRLGNCAINANDPALVQTCVICIKQLKRYQNESTQKQNNRQAQQ